MSKKPPLDLPYATDKYYFQNSDKRADTFAKIYESVLRSKAFQDLNPYARLLYIYMREQEMGKRKPYKEEPYKNLDESSPMWQAVHSEKCFFFSYHDSLFYDRKRYNGNSGKLYKDIKELTVHGFIEVVVSGRNTRTKNVYKFSEKWKQWGEGEKKT